jgi:hypothetical protein
MMENMSPEELAELKRQSATSGDPMAQFSKLMGVPQAKQDDDDDN